MAQHIGYGEEFRLIVFDDTAVGRNIDFAIGESIERIECLVGRDTGCQLYLYFHLGCGEVFHVTCLNLSFLDGFEYRVNNGFGSLGEGNLSNDKGLLVEFLYLRTYFQRTASLSVVVFRNINRAACGEIGIEMKLLAMQITDGCITQFNEIVGQYFRRQTYGNTLGSLCQKQRKLYGQCDGLLVASVVGHLPFGSFRIENRIEGKLRQACLNITRGGSTVAGEDISPVSLGIHQQFFLSDLYQRIANRSIAMWVKLHGVSYDICHLVVATVVHSLHRVKDAALHRL